MARRRPAILVCLLLAGLLGSCSRPAVIRIGLVASLTGRNYDLGISARNGAVLAVEEFDAAGGIRGHRLELVVRDDAHDPEAARHAVEELVREGVVAIVGPITSAMAVETLPIADAQRVLMISPTVSASRFRERDDWLMTLHPSILGSARAMASHVAARRLLHAVAFLDLSNAAFSREWLEEFEAQYRLRGGRLLRSVPFSSGTVASFSALVAAGLAPEADVAIVVANALDTAAIAQQLRKASGIQIVGAEWSLTSDLVEHGGTAVEGALFPQWVNLQDVSARFLRFRQAYEDRFSQPVDFAAVLAYEAVGVLAAGLRRAPSREGIRGAILDIGRFEGLQGEIRVDRNGDCERRLLVATVRDGKTRIVE